ncbi:MAG: sensor histidine kinase [Oscillospiraceae bacterium]
MKWNPRSFGMKLWAWFALFAAIILAALWLLQTVFLQSFYDGMAIRNVQNAAQQIAARQDGTDLAGLLDELAYENSFLIFLTDRQGNILYSTDEHSGVYGRGESTRDTGGEQANPYRTPDETLGWQVGVSHHVDLPRDYGTFLQQLAQSGDGTVGYRLEDGSTYVYGLLLSAAGGDAVLYISTALEAVGATVSLLRIQLVWITAASLLLALVIAFWIARRFSAPVASLSAQARRMAEGDFQGGFEKGFCSELDGLADTLDQTAAELARSETFHKEFLANISHDLRTPLTMIRGYAEMVRDISWEDPEQRETDLTVIIREADRLTGLVNDILEYTALQAKRQTMELETVDLSAQAREVIAQFAPLCEKDGYHIAEQIEPDLLVPGNGAQLARVLYNLIDNALSHAGEKREVRVTLARADSFVRAEVRDWGAGIPREELPYVWERYFTAKQRRRNQKGSGLGLAISKEILLAHHARFGVESGEGEGSVFWFELPVRRSAED